MQSPQEIEFWQQRWSTSDTPWDLLGPHPHLARLRAIIDHHVPAKLPSNYAIFVPACGTAFDALALASPQHHVVAEDIVPEAISAAKSQHASAFLQLRVGNSLITSDDEVGKFGLIYDRAALCAMQPQMRADFIRACFAKLMPNGVFASILFGSIVGELPPNGGPPFAITGSQFADMIKDYGHLLAIEEHPCGTPNTRIGKEVLVMAVKR